MGSGLKRAPGGDRARNRCCRVLGGSYGQKESNTTKVRFVKEPMIDGLILRRIHVPPQLRAFHRFPLLFDESGGAWEIPYLDDSGCYRHFEKWQMPGGGSPECSNPPCTGNPGPITPWKPTVHKAKRHPAHFALFSCPSIALPLNLNLRTSQPLSHPFPTKQPKTPKPPQAQHNGPARRPRVHTGSLCGPKLGARCRPR
jgi:hypothetical protein